jgi:hypothetical protein
LLYPWIVLKNAGHQNGRSRKYIEGARSCMIRAGND